MKKLIVAALAVFALAALVGCSNSSSSSSSSSSSASSGSSSVATEPKDYSQILHDAREDEWNENLMIVSPGEEEGTFTAIDGYSSDLSEDDLNSQVTNLVLPLIGLEEGDYEDFAISVSGIITQSYGVAIVKPAEGKTEAVKAALEDYVAKQQSSMENYLMDQYEIAKAAKVTVVPTGEVVMVCCENQDAVLTAIQDALAA